MRTVAALLALLAALLAPAAARADAVDTAARALQTRSVYESPGNRALDAAGARRVERAINRARLNLRIAELPASAGDPVPVLERLNAALGGRGILGVVVGSSFVAGANRSVGFSVGDLATEAVRDHPNDAEAGLLQFVNAVDRRAESDGAGGGSGGGGVSAVPVLVLLALAFGGAMLFSVTRARQRRRQEEAELDEVKRTANEDLVALGEDIRALDLDVEMPNADRGAKADYERAVNGYDAANQRLNRARSLEDLRGLGEQLEDARYSMACAKARLAGEPVPERRPPCFFDPRHGPSVTDVVWAPPGGEPREVPVCAADATRIEDGLEPRTREVEVGGALRPWWAAPAPYAGYYGGYFSPFGGFGGGFLGGLLVGDLLGHGFGGYGPFGGVPAGYDPGWGGGGDFGGGDFGGGDFGGGDFGGGDFGGGDFGGGDF